MMFVSRDRGVGWLVGRLPGAEPVYSVLILFG